MKPVRACPICPSCGNKRFERLKDNNVTVRCLKCGKVIDI